MKNVPPNRIAELRELAGMTQGQLAKAAKTSQPQIDRLESGERNLTHAWMVRLAKAMNRMPLELIGEPTQKVPVVGYVDAGQTVYLSHDDYAPGEGMYKLDIPTSVGKVVGVEIRGNSMAPRYYDGEVIFYTRTKPDLRELLNQECVIHLTDGTIYLKWLRAGSKPGHFNLESSSPSVPTMIDKEVDWAGPVVYPPRTSRPTTFGT